MCIWEKLVPTEWKERSKEVYLEEMPIELALRNREQNSSILTDGKGEQKHSWERGEYK